MQHRHTKTEFRRSCRGAKECNRMGGNSMRANPLLLSLVAGETARRRSFSDSYWSLVWYQKAEWSQRKFGTTSARHDRNLLVFISRSSLSGFVQQGSRVSRKGSELSMRMLRLSTIGCSSHPQRIINEESHVGTALRPKASRFRNSFSRCNKIVHNIRRDESKFRNPLLKRDVAEKRHETMAPQLLHKTRIEYMDYPLDVLRKHIHQEVRLRKLIFQFQTSCGWAPPLMQ